MSRLRTLAAALPAAAAFLVATAPAGAATYTIRPNASIQAAVDAAKPGDTIEVAAGTYHQNVTITKKNIELRGAGMGLTRLLPATTPTPSACSVPGDPTTVNGICIMGTDGAPVKGTRVSGFSIIGFGGFGVLLMNADNSRVTDTEASGNGGYGISGFVMHGIEFSDDISHDNGDPGFYIGDSPNADAKVEDNIAYRNGAAGEEGDGFLFRDSSHGTVRRNAAWGNCLGRNVVDSPENPAPAEHWELRDNFSHENNRACAGEMGGGAPPLSGIGYAILGAHDVKLTHNVALANAPTGFSVVGSGGIVVVSTAMIGGGTPDHDTIERNSAYNNAPFDIAWDGSGMDMKFKNNACATSAPPGLCT
jgi:hypothetical protein